MGEHENRLGDSREEMRIRRELQQAADYVQPDYVSGHRAIQSHIAKHRERKRIRLRLAILFIGLMALVVINLYLTGSL